MNTGAFNEQYNKLNKQQKEAVDSIYGPIMVVAGPGTGKTQIIGLRTANIILKTGLNPENILITTFTEAGVLAIRKRLVSFLGEVGYKVSVSTIHSFSQEVIKTFPEKFIEFKAGTPIDDVDSLEILKKITDNLIENKQIEKLTTDYDRYFYLRDIKSKISNLKQEGINSGKLSNQTKKQEELYSEELSEIKPTLKKYETTKQKQANHIIKLEELKLFFEAYNTYLREYSLYDFNDMINFVLEKMQDDKGIRQYYAEKYQFIMLDEYQDTNNAQNQIIDLILSESETEANIMTVGDDDQSIYRFQGANIENMLDFSSKYQNTKFIVLEDNYRSNQHILDLSSSLIENNNERLSNKITSINKKLKASGDLKNSSNKPILFKANSQIEEQTYIVNKIKELINTAKPLSGTLSPSQEKGATDLSETAIIVRNNREVEEWSKLLSQNGIEAESKLKTNILNSNYVQLILNYIELINNPYSNENLLINLVRTSLIGLDQVDIFKINRALYISNYSNKIKTTFFDFISNESNFEELRLNNKKALKSFLSDLADFSNKLNESSFVDFFGYFIEKTEILKYIEKEGNFNDLEDIFTLFNKIKDWNKADKKLDLEKILLKIKLHQDYNILIPRQILSEKIDGVQVLTAHSSKGLEYNNVFIPGLYIGNWDSKRKIDRLKLPIGIAGEGLQNTNFDQGEEDRRLFFVATTRARDNLFISYPAGIGNKPLLESSFIKEIEGLIYETEIGVHNSEIKEVTKNILKNNLIKYNDLEFEYIENFLKTYKLSPSDLNAFLEDPLEFLNRVVFKYPFIDNQFTIFGKVYHRTLELFYLKYKSEGKLPEKTYFTSTFSLLLEKEILTPEEQEKLHKKGVEGLAGYYDKHSSVINEPLILEYSFRRKNIMFEGIPLTGTIDKVEKIGTSSSPLAGGEQASTGSQLAFFKDKVALIDYKTGKIKTLGQLKGLDRYGNKKEGEGKYFRQLMFYKLLCEQDFEFNSKFDIGSVAIDFVEGKDGEYRYIELEISDEEYENFKNEIIDSWKKITDIDFWREILIK